MRRAIIVLGIALLAGSGYWLWHNLEWKEEEVDRGYSEAARQNPLLAAEQFLRSTGLATESRRGFSLIDGMGSDTSPVAANDNLVLINAHRTLHRERLDTLWAWVHTGGHLLVSTRNRFLGSSSPEQDPLLARLGVSLTVAVKSEDGAIESGGGQARGRRVGKEPRHRPEATGETRRQDTENTVPESKTGCPPPAVNVNFAGQAEPLRIGWYNRRSLVDNSGLASGWVESRLGVKLLQFELGEGMITLTTDNQIWANHRIDCHDHAYLLWLFTGNAGKTWFVINRDAPSLWSTVWRAAPYGMIFALLALLLWLWKQPIRFGPILVYTRLERRRFLEHAEANAAFLWRHGQQQLLINSLREDINQRLRARHRGVEELARAVRVNLLSRITLLPAPVVTDAMLGAAGDSEQDFQQLVAQLQIIRSRL